MERLNSEKFAEIEIDAASGVDFCEEHLAMLEHYVSRNIVLKLVSSFSSQFFSEIWVAILVGSLCRSHLHKMEVIAWGLHNWRESPYFARSLPGIAAIQMSPKVYSDSPPESMTSAEIFHSRTRWQQIVKSKMRTVIELDPQVAGLRPNNENSIKKYLFEALNELELGYVIRGFQVGEDNEISHILKFVYELYDNAYSYSMLAKAGKVCPGVRFLRIRNHLARDRNELLGRAGSDGVLRAYLEAISEEFGEQGLIEISVSDFGPGILQHFLNSPKGEFYRARDKSALLHDLVHANLSSKSDQGAGQGLPKAIKAARGLRGFISLRTDAFRLCQSFAHNDKADLEYSTESRGVVAGSHWQLLWPIIGL